MKIAFEKYHGTGNDFILVDHRDAGPVPDAGEIARLCDRRFGIGADGLILLSMHEGYDFAMTYYNSDGKESSMCGNGGRCITAFARSLGMVSGRADFVAADGPHQCLITGSPEGTLYRLKMTDTHIREDEDGFFLDTGSPHFVAFVDDVWQLDVFREGRALRHEARFLPGGANINFAQRVEGGLFVRTYERGVEDETLSCGTGVTAAALALAFREPGRAGCCRVETRGGKLSVSYRQAGDQFSDVWLEGPATFVFRGEWVSGEW